MSTATEQPISRYGANMEHKDKYITLLQEQVKEEQWEKKKLQQQVKDKTIGIDVLEQSLKEKNQDIESYKTNEDYYETKLEEEQYHNKELEEHNKELTDLVTELIEKIREWHTEDKRHMETTIHSRENIASRYERDLNKVL